VYVTSELSDNGSSTEDQKATQDNDTTAPKIDATRQEHETNRPDCDDRDDTR